MGDPETTRSLTTLGAVILGFVLGQLAELIRSKRADRKLKGSTRTLVELEVERNRSLLSDYWRHVIVSSDSWRGEDGALNYIKVARAVIKFPFPPVGKSVWLASFNNLASAYSSRELPALWSSHEVFDQLRLLHGQMEFLNRDSADVGRYTESRSDLPTGILSQLVGSAHFASGAEHLAQQFETQMRNVLGQLYVEFPQ